MPSPDFQGEGFDWIEDPHTPTEILGRGRRARKSKTYIKDQELANILGHIEGHAYRLLEQFRRLHAARNTVKIQREDDDGHVVTEHVPEVLTDDELRQAYPVIAEWERLHMEQVEHYASIEGFSVKRATAAPEDGPRSKRDESSAGADAPKRNQDQASSNPKWR